MKESQNAHSRLKSTKALDIMSRFAITIRQHESVTNLAHLMMRFKISGVPVVNNHGAICGIATATDLFNLMKQAPSQGTKDYEQMTVSELMTKNVTTIEENTALSEIIAIMCERNIHTLPVMSASGEEIVGVIGRRDILNAFYVGVGKEAK